MIEVSNLGHKDVKLNGETFGKIILPTEDTVAYLCIGEYEFLQRDLQDLVDALLDINK